MSQRAWGPGLLSGLSLSHLGPQHRVAQERRNEQGLWGTGIPTLTWLVSWGRGHVASHTPGISSWQAPRSLRWLCQVRG